MAREGLENLETQACTSEYVPGTARNVHVNVQITDMAGEPVLLPVWIMAYRFRDQLYRFLVNGQTGRATGQAPLSMAKIFAAIAIALLIIAVFVAFVRECFWRSASNGCGRQQPIEPLCNLIMRISN